MNLKKKRNFEIGKYPLPEGTGLGAIEDPDCTRAAFGSREPARMYAMEILADYRINMVKLKSRPIHGNPWQYMSKPIWKPTLPDRKPAPWLKRSKNGHISL
jgi:hypothetical protein